MKFIKFYHGGPKKIKKIDPRKLQTHFPVGKGFKKKVKSKKVKIGKGYAEFGKGFYGTTDKAFAKAYGLKISEFKINPSASVLTVPYFASTAKKSDLKDISPKLAKIKKKELKIEDKKGGFGKYQQEWMDSVRDYADKLKADVIVSTYPDGKAQVTVISLDKAIPIKQYTVPKAKKPSYLETENTDM